MYKCVTNAFNVLAFKQIFHKHLFLIDTKLYTCEVCAYSIKYLSGACLIARVGHALLVR